MLKKSLELQIQTFTDLLTSVLYFRPLDNDLEVKAGPIAEYIVKIELSVRVSQNLHLEDSFEWDLTNPDNSPEEFSAMLVADYLHSLDSKRDKFSPIEVNLLEKSVALEIRRQIDVQVMK